MVTLRLFKAAEPFKQIEARNFAEGEITIGRDPQADWSISDPSRDLSSRHCSLHMKDGAIFLKDTSTNGVLIGLERRPAPRAVSCELASGETIYLGDYLILLDNDEPAGADLSDEQAVPEAVLPRSPDPRSSGPVTDAALLEAFCRGAGLEPSSFAGEDPSAVMSRLGVVYRQVVDDLCALMRDRAMLKSKLQMDRTTISARDNNPLKWAPPHRVAVDLLQEDEAGFLKGAEAFRASFADLRRHGASMLAGSRSAVQHVLDELSTDAMEANLKRQPLHFVVKSDAAWKTFKERHAHISADKDSGESGVERAFRSGYEQHQRATEGGEAT